MHLDIVGIETPTSLASLGVEYLPVLIRRTTFSKRSSISRDLAYNTVDLHEYVFYLSVADRLVKLHCWSCLALAAADDQGLMMLIAAERSVTIDR
jgi:hypothetical protein